MSEQIINIGSLVTLDPDDFAHSPKHGLNIGRVVSIDDDILTAKDYTGHAYFVNSENSQVITSPDIIAAFTRAEKAIADLVRYTQEFFTC